jgi:hypothetical protein
MAQNYSFTLKFGFGFVYLVVWINLFTGADPFELQPLLVFSHGVVIFSISWIFIVTLLILFNAIFFS